MMSTKDFPVYHYLTKDTLTEEEYAVLTEEYFRADKSDWYEEVEGEKEWDEDRVDEFWQLIRKFPMATQKEWYDFESFVFPDFGNNENGEFAFWEDDMDKKFEKEVSFDSTTFLGDASFNSSVFIGNTDFMSASFSGEADFMSASFSGDTDFMSASFSGKAYFGSASFNGEADFMSASFSGKAYFRSASFSREADFMSASFSGEADFMSASFSADAYFSSASFIGDAYYRSASFSGDAYFISASFRGDTGFIRTQFSPNHETLFQDLEGKPALNFRTINFPDKLIFRRVDFTNTSFKECDVVEAQFRECSWSGGNRIKLLNEKEDNLEGLYRMLKKNFENAKDYELAGRAYRSEMKMKAKRVFKEKPRIIKFFEYCIYGFYNITSGYNQSVMRPLLILVVLTFGVFPFLYSDCMTLFNVKKSVYNALPFTRFTLEATHFTWLIIQKILSLVLVAFFILALRRRFKI